VKDNRAYYDDFSRHYDDARGRGYHALLDDLEAECVRRWLPGARVLEVGCGTGLLLERVRRFAAGATGMDLSGGMLSRARARGLTVCRASAIALPYREGSFDLVFSFKVLPHIEALDQALAEAARVLTRGGIALLEFYNPASLRGMWKRLRWWNQRVGSASHDREVYTAYHTPEAARARARAAGLEVVGGYGIFVVTPHPLAHRWPLAGALLGAMERTLTQGPFARWAGFYIVACRKPGGRR
jgi:ubiquinone/menaquinone biosynthesis C-methylase UbiE